MSQVCLLRPGNVQDDEESESTSKRSLGIWIDVCRLKPELRHTMDAVCCRFADCSGENEGASAMGYDQQT